MDAYEATKIVLSRIQGLDPENASKIMGYILIQDQGEKEMIRLAFGPEIHLVSLMSEAKACLGLESNRLSATPRITIPNNNGVFTRSPRPPSSLSYAAVVNGSTTGLSFVDESIMSPSGRSDSLVYPFEETPHHHHLHRRSYSVNDAFVDDGGNSNGWGPCMYYARGFCKNGNTCKFVHTGDSSDAAIVASPTKLDSFDDFLRIKALQQQRFAAASLMARQHYHHPLAYNNILNDNERSAAAAFMMGEDIHKIGRCHPDRNDFSVMAMGASSSRQIYLTFPADSTFKEEDVSNYFSMYGPVQDVRIPYQQKRMFGFVTFVHPETVKLILAKGNPHFVCDSRVLVKPYKEKGKVMDKRQQHPIDRELMSCLSPSGLESREPYDLPFGGRMLYNSHEMMLRRKLEQEAELQQAIELQGRRLMNLQLMDLNNQHRNHHFPVSHSPGMPIHTQNSHILGPLSNGIDQEIPAENYDTHETPKSPSDVDDEKVPSDVGNEGGNKEQTTDTDDSYLHYSLEHILPDNLFASPTKSAAEQQATFSTEAGVSSPITSNNISMLPTTSTLNMASVNSCYLHMPRFTSGQEAIEM